MLAERECNGHNFVVVYVFSVIVIIILLFIIEIFKHMQMRSPRIGYRENGIIDPHKPIT